MWFRRKTKQRLSAREETLAMARRMADKGAQVTLTPGGFTASSSDGSGVEVTNF